MTATHLLKFVVALASQAATLSACPLCDSETASQVRAGLLDDQHVADSLLATIMPFLLLAAFVAAVHFGLPVPRKRSRAKKKP
jgi:hypothetical protein